MKNFFLPQTHPRKLQLKRTNKLILQCMSALASLNAGVVVAAGA